MQTPPRRLWFLSLFGTLLGLVGGAAAWVLLHLIALITNVALFHQWGWSLPSFADYHPGLELIPVAVAGALVVTLLARWSPNIRGHGIPEAQEVVLSGDSRISPRTAVAKPLSAAVAIGTGGPFGAEGPIIVTGGAIGSLLGQVLHVTPSERKILLAAGAAGGMAAVFGAPLASVLLAVELLLFEFSARALVPLVISSSVAAAVHAALFGAGPLFHVPPHQYAGLGSLWVFALLGIACGALAVVVVRGLFVVEGAFRRLPFGVFWHPMLGALAFATIGILVPRALGVGYQSIDDVLANRLAVGTLVALLLAKLIAWWVALASGTSGGTLAPILLISGCFGGLAGALVHEVLPGAGISAGAVALVAMAATFGAATRATLTAIVFAFELTRDYHAIVPLMLAAVLADLVAGAYLPESIMTEKLARRGLRVPSGYEPDVLRTATVGEIMTRDVVTLPASASPADVLGVVGGGAHRAYPVVDLDGRCVGVVTRDDVLMDASAAPEDPRDLVTAAPSDPVVRALERMVEEGVDHLPVVVDDRLVGICTRTDILRARAGQQRHDQRQPGWITRWNGRARQGSAPVV